MTRYAENTTVSVEKSRAELERTLDRYGADQFAYGWDGMRWIIGFRFAGRHYKIILEKPNRASNEIRLDRRGYTRSAPAQQTAYEQAERQRWRALNLIIKGKLEAVELGIETFEQAFLSNLMLPDGSTVGEWIEPQVKAVYDTGQMPSLLPGLDDDTARFRALPSGTSR